MGKNFFSAFFGNHGATEILLQNGAEIDSRDKNGRCPLSYALRFAVMGSGNFEIVKLLFQHGANVNSKDNVGKSILNYAADSDNFRAVETLIEYGADVNTKENYSGKTALHYAVANENIDIKGPSDLN